MAVRTVIVDDNDDLVFLMTTWLSLDDRFEVVGIAHSGEEAVDVCSRMRPDSVLLDVDMTRMDGIAALPLVLAACPTARIVVYSSDPSAREAAFAAGAHAWHLKTDPIGEVIDALAASE